MIKTIEKNIYLPHDVNLVIDLCIPLGDDVCVDALEDDFVDDIMIKQIERGVRGVTTKYAESALPIQYLRGTIVATNGVPIDIFGFYNSQTDMIFVDPDNISLDFRGIKKEFLFGHEMGHKLQKYCDCEEVYDLLSRLWGIDRQNTRLLQEVYSDIVGNIVSNGYYTEEDNKVLASVGCENGDEEIYHLETFIDPDKSSFVKKRVLHSIYHV